MPLEGNHHVQFPIQQILSHELQGLPRGQQGRFPQGYTVVLIQDVPKFRQVFMQPGAVLAKADTLARGEQADIVRQAPGFGDKRDHILPESVHP